MNPASTASAEIAPFNNLDELEERARALLPQSIYDYFAGGAEEEATVSAFPSQTSICFESVEQQ